VALMESLPQSRNPRFRDLVLTPEHIREVRYAALLHDFGKIGVQESILVKSHKLPADRLELIRYRIELHKERLRRQAVERELALLHEAGMEAPVAIRRVHRELAQELSRLDEFFGWIKHANLPNVMEAGDYEHLRTLREYEYQEIDGSRGSLIDDGDLMALSVRRGSLTPEERQVIQTHVIHTRDFLETLPWPPELAGVPAIAGAHHEKLDGSGYPYGLRGEDIPLPSRVMTICDIYDALTAMDRPYKSAMSPDRALEILGDEARAGLIDGDILKVFINARIYLLDQPSARVAV
jgi:response regulator RpfG family c-di-GMP phosphodiesterase